MTSRSFTSSTTQSQRSTQPTHPQCCRSTVCWAQGGHSAQPPTAMLGVGRVYCWVPITATINILQPHEGLGQLLAAHQCCTVSMWVWQLQLTASAAYGR